MNDVIRAKIKQAMEEQKLTQQALADDIGISQGAVQQFISGSRGRPSRAYQALLDRLGLELIVVERKDGK